MSQDSDLVARATVSAGRRSIGTLHTWVLPACMLASVLPVLLILGPAAIHQPDVYPSILIGALLVGGGVGATVGLLLAQRLARALARLTQLVQLLDRDDSPDAQATLLHAQVEQSGPAELWALAHAIFQLRARLLPPASALVAPADSMLARVVQVRERALPAGPDNPLEAAARSAQDGLWDWDLATDAIYLSPRWHAIAGVTDGEDLVPSSFWLERVHREDVSTLRTALAAHLRGEMEHFACHARIRGDDGEYRWTLCRGLALRREDGTPYRIAGSLTDVTERRSAEARLLHDAVHDGLTGLANRAALVDRLTAIVAEAATPADSDRRAAGGGMAVLLLDIDRFKVVNDSLGHTAGDQVLIAAAQRVEAAVPGAAVVARLGGDELAVLLDSLPSTDLAVQAAERIRSAFREPLRADNHRVFVTVSVGIALAGEDAAQPEGLLRDAETAMYRAKELGRDRVVVFESALHERMRTRLALEADLRFAIERDELLLYFQPIVGVSGSGAFGMEALVRWRHPVRGLVPPAEFIPFAEESGLIVPLGGWVLKQTVSQMQAWQAAGLAPERVAVNLSARQLRREDLAEQVERVLREAGVDPGCLELELTESVVAEHSEATLDVVRQLRQLGVQLAVDDFGTGYSSLAYLARFPVATLKVDRTFLVNIERDTVHQAIVSAVTTLAHRIGARVVAEGVETESQLAVARSLGCDEVQGYLISGPLSVAEATAWLADQRRRRLLRPVTRLPGAS